MDKSIRSMHARSLIRSIGRVASPNYALVERNAAGHAYIFLLYSVNLIKRDPRLHRSRL